MLSRIHFGTHWGRKKPLFSQPFTILYNTNHENYRDGRTFYVSIFDMLTSYGGI